VTSQATFISNGSSVIKYPAIKAVKDYVDGVTTGLLRDNGNYDPTITGDYPTSADTLSGGAIQVGDLWYISVAGTMNGNSVLVGYSVRALVNAAGPTTDADWAIANVGLGFIPEDSANKSDDATFNSGIPSHTEFPTQYAVATYLAANAPAPDLQTVLGNGHTLTNGRNFQGDIAGVGNTGFDVNAFGQAAGYNNSGDNVNGLGVDAAHDNGGDDVNAMGNSSAQVNVGSNVNAFGSAAANGNTGSHVNALGRDAGISNAYSYVSLFGNNAQASADDQLAFANGAGYSAQISNTNITANRKYELPNQAGTIALTSDIVAPYAVYTALLSWDGSSITVNVLQNTLGVTLTWTIPFNGTLRGTASSGTPFTSNKTWLTSGGQSTGSSSPYIVASAVRATAPTTEVEWRFFFHDGTITGTPLFTNYSIEIRVYP
jgi:hypothetical protein